MTPPLDIYARRDPPPEWLKRCDHNYRRDYHTVLTTVWICAGCGCELAGEAA